MEKKKSMDSLMEKLWNLPNPLDDEVEEEIDETQEVGSKKKKRVEEKKEDLVKTKFLSDLEFHTKDRLYMENASTIEHKYKMFVDGILGGKTGLKCKMKDLNSALLSAYESAILSSKIDASDFYDEYIKTGVLPVSGFSEKALPVVKKFLTESIFKASKTSTPLLDRMFDEDNQAIAPQLLGILSFEETIMATALYCIEKSSGNVVVLPDETKVHDALAKQRLQTLEERLDFDYDRIEGTEIMVRKHPINDRNTSATVQDDLVDLYKGIIRKYFKNPRNMLISAGRLSGEEAIHKHLSKAEFLQKEQKLENVLQLLEERMSSDSKQKIKEDKVVLAEFCENLDIVYDTYGLGQAYELYDALKTCGSPKGLSSKQMKKISDFNDAIKEYSKVLKSSASDVQKKLSFFALMKMNPRTFLTVCQLATKNVPDFDVKSAEKILKELESKNMFGKVGFTASRQFSTDKDLEQFNSRKATVSGVVVYDHLGNEKFGTFVSEVERYAEDYDLPKDPICFRTIAESIIENEENAARAKQQKTK